MAAILFASPAVAQIGTGISILSDDRFRGFSLSDGHPVAIAELSYDLPGGTYAGASASVLESSGEGLHPLGLQLNGGHAFQLRGDLTADFGAVYARYSRYSGLRAGRTYAEVYAGLSGKLLSSRIYFSPDYFGQGATSYGEVDGHIPVGAGFTFQSHAGLFIPFNAYSRGSHSARRYDWQVGVSRAAGRFVLHANLGGLGPRQYSYGDYSGDHALTFGVDCAL